jgi:hypothetical protein
VVADLPEPGSCRVCEQGCRDCQNGEAGLARGRSARRRLGELPTLAEILARRWRRRGGRGGAAVASAGRAVLAVARGKRLLFDDSRDRRQRTIAHVRGDPASRGSPCQARTWRSCNGCGVLLRQRAVSARHRRQRPDHRFLQRVALARRRSALSMRARGAAGRPSAPADALGRSAAATASHGATSPPAADATATCRSGEPHGAFVRVAQRGV